MLQGQRRVLQVGLVRIEARPLQVLARTDLQKLNRLSNGVVAVVTVVTVVTVVVAVTVVMAVMATVVKRVVTLVVVVMVALYCLNKLHHRRACRTLQKNTVNFYITLEI